MRISPFHPASLLLSIGLAVSSLRAADLATHLFPHKDGEVSPNSGGNRDSVLMVGQSGTSGWITYQTGGADLSLTTGSSLTLYVDSVHSSGTLKVFALNQAVTPPELDVEAGDLDYDSLSPVATLALTSGDQGKVIRLDLTTLLGSGTFYGLVLGAGSGLHADFGSKDSHLQPLIELRYGFATPAQVDSALTAADDAAVAATAAASSASAAAASATAASASAGAASTSGTNAAASATAAAGSATAAASSATAAASSATSSASSATAAASSATSAASSATTAHAWSDSAASQMSIHGLFIMTDTAVAAPGFTYTGIRRVLEKDWLTKTSAPTARYDIAGAVLSNKLYVSGGYNGSYLTTFEYYDPSTNAWTAKAALPVATHYHAMEEAGGNLYVIGGFQSGGTTPSAATYKYTPGTNTWLLRQPMAAIRVYHASASYSGKIYIFGGSTSQSVANVVTTTTVYDPTANTWTAKAALPTARCSMPAVALGAKIHVIGGTLSDGSYSLAHDVYDPAANTWSTAAPLPVAMDSHRAVAADGKIYVMGGSPDAFNFQYDPSTDSWVKLLPSNTTRFSGACGYINGTIYVADGYAGGPTASTEAYALPMSAYYHKKN